MKTFSIVTLGCKVNAYESEYYREVLIKKNYEEAEGFEDSDLIIINTCTVTNQASFKSRQKINQAKKLNPSAKLVVVGCYVQSNHEELQEKYNIDLLIGNKNKDRFAELIDSMDESMSSDFSMPKTFENIPITNFKNKTRAFLKIQDGCNQFCSYCIIPYTRGRERSLAQDDVIEMVKQLEKDHLEIVLAGIHTGKYGTDIKCNLSDLIQRMLNETKIERIRLSSIDINEVDDQLIELIKNNRRLAQHLHISLQSGDDEVLKLMNRPYTTNQFRERIKQIRKEIPNISISTDVIVGFSNETDEKFENTLNFINEIGFSFLHVFPYSIRKFTKAAQFEQLNSEETKKKRVHILTERSKVLYEQYLKSLVGSKVSVLIESKDERGVYGFSSAYDCVSIPEMSELSHAIIDCVIVASDHDTLTAKPL
ncbi:MAG: tRNA (N(6)-L-threonylcarbamoyladenosine(37)-C(2))-methylthiotransferase MtaB [Erysipelotrichaceae bacterium]|nr:tRNA (N(6)-L-threonylcarbamoyladenosine(37)-C(2))-methylthiotransferase MtaB [Erysipelotrichaceae bacterium]